MVFCANAATFKRRPGGGTGFYHPDAESGWHGFLPVTFQSGPPGSDASPPGGPCEWVTPMNKQSRCQVRKRAQTWFDPSDFVGRMVAWRGAVQGRAGESGWRGRKSGVDVLNQAQKWFRLVENG